MKKALFFALLATQFCNAGFSQDIIVPDLKGFKKDISAPVYSPENLWDYINDAASTYLDYNFVDLHVAEYKKGRNVIRLEIYRQADNIMAFGIYSAERSPSFRFVKLGSQGYITDGAINFFTGNFYVKIRTHSRNENILKSAEALAYKVASVLPGGTGMPSALSLFPQESKKINEETYINQSVLGHKFLNSAFKASYETGNDVFSIFILQNNSPGEIQKTVNTYMTATGADVADSDISRYMLKDGNNGTIFLSWSGTMLVIISGLSKDQSDIADKYMSEILK